MTLNESTGLFSIRRSLHFELKPVAGTADFLGDVIADNEDRAAGLNSVKDIILAQHLTMIRRVFKSLPDPLPADPKKIREAFKHDPENMMLEDPNAYNVLKVIVDRCRYNKWPLPKAVRDLHGWSALYMKWHWYCKGLSSLFGAESLPVKWAGRPKAEVLATSKCLQVPKKRNPTRGRWYDHAPFRMLFDNHATGMSWLKGDFAASRNFLLVDGDRILVGVVPRKSKVNPYTMPAPLPVEQHYLLYVENPGEAPSFKAIPRALIDAPAHRGFVYLFEIDGRGMRSKKNRNALFLRSLLTQENFEEGVFHLDKACEFHFRKGCYMAQDEKPDHFRQRFSEDKFFITFHVTINAHLVSSAGRPDTFRSVSKYMKVNPYVKFVNVAQEQGGYSITPHSSAEGEGIAPMFISTRDAVNGRLASALVSCVLDHDVNAVFNKNVPEKIKKAIVEKFSYVIVKGRDAFADGGVMRGYQLLDRLFVGTIPVTQAEQEKIRVAQKEASEKAKRERQAERRKTEREAIAVRLRAQGKEPVSPEIDFSVPPFTEGRYKFYFDYTLPDGFVYAGECMANFKSEVYDKLQPLGAKPSKLICYDKEFVEHFQNLPGPDVGSKLYRYKYRTVYNTPMEGTCRADVTDEVHWKLHALGIKPYFVEETDELVSGRFTYTYMNSERVRSTGTIDAASKADAYVKLKKLGIRPIRVLAEGEEPPPVKKFYSEDKQIVKKPQEAPVQVAAPPSPPKKKVSPPKPEEPKPQPPAPVPQPPAPAPQPPAPAPQPPAPAPQPSAPALTIAERLKRINALKADGLLTEEEYAAQRSKIIAEL